MKKGFQPLKRDVASLAIQYAAYLPDGFHVSTPQAGRGLFSRDHDRCLPDLLESFQPLKRDVASLAAERKAGSHDRGTVFQPLKRDVASLAFSRQSFAGIGFYRFNPSSGTWPL